MSVQDTVRFPRGGYRLARTILLSVSVGMLSGLAAKMLESSVQLGMNAVIGRVSDPGAAAVLRFHWGVLLLPALGGAISAVLVGLLCRPTRAHGTAVLIDAFHHQDAEIPLKDSVLKAVAAVAVIACGGSVGKEAPIAVLGAALGTTLAGALGMSPRERRIYLVAGCAAGVGAIFQCPLGGAIFATTVLYRRPEIEGEAVMPSIVASVTSYSTFMAFGGYGHRLLSGTGQLAFRHPAELLPYVGLAFLCVLVGILFHQTLRLAPRLLAKARTPGWLAPAVAGLAGGVIACGLPQVMDARYSFIQRSLDGGAMLAEHAWLGWVLLFALVLLGKCVATSLMMGAGSAGGLFGPVIFLGGVAGAMTGAILEVFAPSFFPESLRQCLIPVGMAGVLSASLRTPLAAIVMVTEMTGSYGLIVPLMLVSILSYMLGRRWGVYAEQVADAGESPAHAGDAIVGMLESWKVKDLMERSWSYVATPSTSLRELVTLIRHGTRPTFAVIEGRRLVGSIPMERFASAAAGGNAATVIVAADIMSPPTNVISPDDDLYGTLELFLRHGVDVLPVARGPDSEFAGMLTREAILHAIRDHLSERRRQVLREHAGFAALAQESLLEGIISGLSSDAGGMVKRMGVPEGVAGLSLSEAEFRRRFHCQVVAIETASKELVTPPDPRRPLAADDVLLVVQGPAEDPAPAPPPA